MESLKEFIRLHEETTIYRKKLAEQLMVSTFFSSEMRVASDFIIKMSESAQEAGVLSVEEKDGKYRLLVDFKKYLEIAKAENPFVEYESNGLVTKHYRTCVEEIEIVTVELIWKETKNASA